MLQQLQSRTPYEWRVLFTTWMGMLFDGMDASIFVLALYPTLSELLNTTSHSEVGVAASYVLAAFMVGWTVGSAIFGVVADRIGRVNTMVLTILLYAVCTGLCATSHSTVELAIYRFFVGCGIGGELSVGAVFLAESWKGKGRYWATGVMCTAFGFGYLLTACLNYGLGGFGWRALYLVGIVPALLTIYIRLKLKDSHHFAEAAERRVESSALDKVAPILTVFNSENRGKSFCVLALATAAIVGYWAVLAWVPAWVNQLTGTNATLERSTCAVVLNVGAIIGALALGGLFEKLGRKKSFFYSYLGALVSCIAMFLTVKSYGPELLAWVFVVGFFTEAPFVPLLIYVPELFNAKIRVTAFGVSVQLGRLFAATAAVMAGQLIALFGGSYALAGSCVALVYIVGMVASLVLPQSTGNVAMTAAPATSEKKRQLAGATT